MKPGFSYHNFFFDANIPPVPEGLEEHFGVGKLKLYEKEGMTYVLCTQSSDLTRVKPLAAAIDDRFKAGFWGGDLIVSFDKGKFDGFVGHLAPSAPPKNPAGKPRDWSIIGGVDASMRL